MQPLWGDHLHESAVWRFGVDGALGVSYEVWVPLGQGFVNPLVGAPLGLLRRVNDFRHGELSTTRIVQRNQYKWLKI
jgi:hypothetical protein